MQAILEVLMWVCVGVRLGAIDSSLAVLFKLLLLLLMLSRFSRV